ncbi:MAG: nucleotidyltransferase family protein [bacterium]
MKCTTEPNAPVQAVLLCGGRGTRLSTLYPDRPKALAPVAGRPFLEWQLDWLERAGVKLVHLAAGHMAAQLQDWTAASGRAGLTVSIEPRPLGTGGGLKFIEPHLHCDPFLVLNGDSLMPRLDIGALLAAHRATHAPVTLAIAPIEDAGRYGTVEAGADGVITAFREKAPCAEGWINGGVYVVSRAVLKLIPAGQTLSLETDIFPGFVTEGRLRAFRSRPPLLDMGTPEGLAAMTMFLQQN